MNVKKKKKIVIKICQVANQSWTLQLITELKEKQISFNVSIQKRVQNSCKHLKLTVLAKVDNSCKPVTAFPKYSFLDMLQGSKSPSAACLNRYKICNALLKYHKQEFLLYRRLTSISRSSHQRCSIEKLFLKISQYS